MQAQGKHGISTHRKAALSQASGVSTAGKLSVAKSTSSNSSPLVVVDCISCEWYSATERSVGRGSESWLAGVGLSRRKSNNWWCNWPASVPGPADSEMPASPPAGDGWSGLVLLRYCSRLLLDRRTIVRDESSVKEG